jgi:hypothetical protein
MTKDIEKAVPQTEIVIYPGLPTRLRGSENNKFTLGLAMNIEK